MVTRGPVMLLLLLSIPSTVKLLLRGRCPPTDGPVPTPTEPLVATPAFSRERLIIPEPWAPIGRSCSWRVSKLFYICAFVVSMLAAAADTSTLVAAVPTASVTFRVEILFNSTEIGRAHV